MRSEKQQGLDPRRMPYDLEDEPIFLYIYTWNNGQMERIPNDEVGSGSLAAIYSQRLSLVFPIMSGELILL